MWVYKFETIKTKELKKPEHNISIYNTGFGL